MAQEILGHISRQRIERLVKDGILQDLNFTDFDTCVDCIKGKLTAKARKSKNNRCIDVLDLIYTNICGPFTPPTMGGFKYFIILIDDVSCYGHVELIHEEFDFLEAFKALRLRWSFKRERRLRQLIMIEVVSIMGYMMRMDIVPDCLLDICRIVALMLDIQCQELQNRMGL